MVRAKKLTGLPSLAYKGVEAPTPPNLTIATRIPTTSDNQNVRVGDLWLNYTPGFPSVGTFSDLFLLISLERGIATWVNVGPAGAGAILFVEDNAGNPVGPDGAGILNVIGVANINTVANPGTNSIEVNLNEVIRWSATNGTGTTGVIYLNGNGSVGTGGTRFMHAFRDNTFLGLNAGNFSLTVSSQFNTGIGQLALTSLTSGQQNTMVGRSAGSNMTTGDRNTGVGEGALLSLDTGADNVAIGVDALLSATTANANVSIGTSALSSVTDGVTNVAVGFQSLQSVTTGDSNVAVGQTAGDVLTTGDSNTMVGPAAGALLDTGSNNVLLGATAGGNYSGAESDNVILYDTGTAGDNNTIRIGTQGTQTRAFCAGITGVTVANETNVVIDSSTGQLGVLDHQEFLADTDSTISDVTGDDTSFTIPFDNVRYDVGGNYDNNTGIYTIPITGLYHFNTVVTIGDLSSSNTRALFRIGATGAGAGIGGWGFARFNPWEMRDGILGWVRLSGSQTLALDAGDQVFISVSVNGPAKTVDLPHAGGTVEGLQFSGYRVA